MVLHRCGRHADNLADDELMQCVGAVLTARGAARKPQIESRELGEHTGKACYDGKGKLKYAVDRVKEPRKKEKLQHFVKWIDSRTESELEEGVRFNKSELKFIADRLREYFSLLDYRDKMKRLDGVLHQRRKERMRQRIKEDTIRAYFL
ncbi:hypothetical protein [Selenomonas sp. AE3005]|uniref:hypothetical protein n=1 Tax=Selenomonas sp. AE3005 TaxID=1485543 RepID=UPI0025D78AD7|nr:hypothetical protein [Selenomonas sp. AE3005]